MAWILAKYRNKRCTPTCSTMPTEAIFIEPVLQIAVIGKLNRCGALVEVLLGNGARGGLELPTAQRAAAGPRPKALGRPDHQRPKSAPDIQEPLARFQVQLPADVVQLGRLRLVDGHVIVELNIPTRPCGALVPAFRPKAP